MNHDLRFKNKNSGKPINHKSYLLNQIFKEFFFAFLVILLIILIYGLFQKTSDFSFFVRYWKKLDLILGIEVIFGTLAVWSQE